MIPLSDVDITDVEAAYVAEAMSQRWISGTGSYIHRFEAEIGRIVGVEHVIAVANGTLAIELALRCLGIGVGDEVILPALTFAAPAMSVIAVGAKPVLVDIDPDSWTISAESVSHRITSCTKAIIAVDLLGHPAHYDALRAFGVPIIEDAAEAHGSTYQGRAAGSLGDISVFSFHANKTITTGEGGAVCTSSPSLANRMRTMANHGMVPNRPFYHEDLGRNFRMTNLTAAIGLGQTERWDALVSARRRVARYYANALAGTAYGTRPTASWAEWSCWLQTITTERQSKVVEFVRSCGIDARAIWPALNTQPALSAWSYPCPVAEDIAGKAIFLPTSSRLTTEEIDQVVDSLRRAQLIDQNPASS